MLGMIVSFDQLSKFLVAGNMSLGATHPLIENIFNLTLVHNPGAAFGLFSGLHADWREPLFFILPGITLSIIFFAFIRLQESQKFSIYSLSMIVGGALGNLIDRLRLGYVIDFVDFHWKNKYHFPAFNLADSGITIGIFILLFSIFFEKEREG